MPLNQWKNLTFAVLLAAGLWGAQRFGPALTTNRVHARSGATISQPGVQSGPVTGCPASAPAGALASGQEAQSAQVWLDSLEARYRARGFQRLEVDPGNPLKPPAGSSRGTKFYWRAQIGDQGLIGAMGEGADPRSDAGAAEAQSFVTAVTAAIGGGSQWAVYSFDTATAAKWLDQMMSMGEAGVSGRDPAGIPLHPGMRRMIGLNFPGGGDSEVMAIYSSNETPDALHAWYRRQMQAAGWQLDSTVTEEAGAMADGMLCFSRVGQGCLVWISREENGGHTTVTIGTFNR